MTTTLTGKNQITVPAEITRRLGLAAGAQFDWAVSDQPDQITITIKPSRKQLLERVRAIGRKFRKPGQDPVADLIRARGRRPFARRGSVMSASQFLALLISTRL